MFRVKRVKFNELLLGWWVDLLTRILTQARPENLNRMVGFIQLIISSGGDKLGPVKLTGVKYPTRIWSDFINEVDRSKRVNFELNGLMDSQVGFWLNLKGYIWVGGSIG